MALANTKVFQVLCQDSKDDHNTNNGLSLQFLFATNYNKYNLAPNIYTSDLSDKNMYISSNCFISLIL